MSFEDCILRGQDVNRYMYRPIIRLNIDNSDYCLIGMNKWHESFVTLTSNALPFGICPEEWKQHTSINKYIIGLQNTHDKLLEDAAVEILKSKKLKFDRNIKSIRPNKGNNISIIKKDIGEIDIAFINPENNIIFICESKHNRSRFDWFNWKRDYSNFKDTYEKKLTNKVSWVKKNKVVFLEHLEYKCNVSIDNKEDNNVEGLFIINAPTIYMYNSHFPTLTLFNLERMITTHYELPTFICFDENDLPHTLEPPYFDNLEAMSSILKINRISWDGN